MTSARSTALSLRVYVVFIGLAGCASNSPAGPPVEDRPTPKDTFEDAPAPIDVSDDDAPVDDRPEVAIDTAADAAGTDAVIDRGVVDVPREAGADAERDAGDVGSDAPADDAADVAADGGADVAAMGCGGGSPCVAGLTCCDGRCVDTRADRRHCGVCGRTCTAVCNAGLCAGAMQFALGQEHTCVALSDRSVRCWGRNDEGQLGIGTMSSAPVLRPVVVPTMTNTSYLQAGRHHTYGRTEAGTIALWGENAGALGDGATAPRSTPYTLPGISGIGIGRSIAAAPLRGCVVAPLARLSCWGANAFGQLGDGTTDTRLSPVEVRDIAVTRVATGPVHTCAILSDRTMRCWGRNANGQLGDASTMDRSRPTEVMGISVATDLCAGEGHSCARLADATVRCWGRNTEGQLGDGTLTDRATPTAVPGLERITSVSCGAFHTCAVRSDGTVWCWGSNLQGELGGTSTERTVPTPHAVGMLPNSVFVFAGWHRTCTVTVDNAGYCWGDNTRGALGDGTTTARRTPTAVAW